MNEDLFPINNLRKFINNIPPETLLKSRRSALEEGFSDDMLPFDLYRGKPQNIGKLADQINKSYYYGIYDGTSILMRRLLEMLLILVFKKIKQEDLIRDEGGNYLPLSQIINKSIRNKQIDLTRNAKDYLGIFKERGDLSAHNPFYNCTQKDLQNVQHKYRSLVEELFYKSGINK